MRTATVIVHLFAVYATVVRCSMIGRLRGFSESFLIQNQLEGKESSAPLEKCSAGCREHRDCEEGLKCFHHWTEGGTAPGCDAKLLDNEKNYCYDPADEIVLRPRYLQEKPLILVGNNGTPALGFPADSFPLGRCEGDCDNDAECEGSLLCFNRTDDTAVPGCDSSTGRGGVDYCYDPSVGGGATGTYESDTLIHRGNDNVPSSAFPLGRCEGDCDSDSDCEGGLECYLRSGSQPVPGCWGAGIESDDYCFRPGDSLLWTQTNHTWPADAFRLRLYWSPSYNWQETSAETWWCMECDRGTCNPGDNIRIYWCDMENTRFVFLDRASDNAIQVQIGGTNLCLEKDGLDDMKVQVCDASESKQWWISQEGGWSDFRFELRPIDDTSRCLSQAHHPKSEERVYPEPCGLAHEHDTGFWSAFPI